MDLVSVGLDIGFLLCGVIALILSQRESTKSLPKRAVKAGIVLGCVIVCGGSVALLADIGRLPEPWAAEQTGRILRFIFYVAFIYFFWVLRAERSGGSSTHG